MKTLAGMVNRALNRALGKEPVRNYYVAETMEVFGGYEASSKMIVGIEEGTDMEQWKDEWLREWRQSDPNDKDEDTGGYWFDCNFVKWVSLVPISKEHADIVNRYI